MTQQEVKEYQNMKHSLGRFRHYINNAKEERPMVIMESLVYLADVFFDNYAKEPGKTERFEAKNPELAASVAREIEEVIQAGWAKGATLKVSDYIGYHIYEADKAWKSPEPAEELDVFAKVLVKAAK